MKLFASTLTVALFAASGAFAQMAPATPTQACKTGDTNCATPLNTDKEAPVGSGRSATEVGTQGGALDNASPGAGMSKPAGDTEGAAKEIKKDGAGPMEGNSNK